ncbi:MAG: F0F1 ATP synthase subunit A [Rickettsiales bacterium]|nr:F0F1 ATP synthase subunit A [Rickettsiales bacterium]
MAESHGPLHQFEVHSLFELPKLAGYSIDFTNSSLFMVAAVAVIYLFLTLGMRQRAMVPGHWQSLVEMGHDFIASTLRDTAGEGSKPFIPFMFTVFFFVLTANLLGLVPYSFTVTSHIIVTFALSALVFLGVTAVGFYHHGLHFLKMFVPSGVPLPLIPLLVPIEVISYLARPITLSIRLAANMTAGHILLKVVAGFVIALGIAGVVPLLLLVGLIGFEVFIAFLQAYIFTILTCVYLHDALHMH